MSEMTGITEKGKDMRMKEPGTFREERPVLTDLALEGLDIELSTSLQDRNESAANARAKAYRDRILEAAGRSKGTA